MTKHVKLNSLSWEEGGNNMFDLWMFRASLIYSKSIYQDNHYLFQPYKRFLCWFFFFKLKGVTNSYTCLPVCLCQSHYHSPACPHAVPKGCVLQTPISAEEEEVPSVNTECFEMVQADNTKWLNNLPRKAPQLLVQKIHLC